MNLFLRQAKINLYDIFLVMLRSTSIAPKQIARSNLVVNKCLKRVRTEL